MKTPHDPEELLTIVDEQDKVIGKHPRNINVDGKLHRQTSLFLFNKNNELLIQIRSDNEKLDPSSSGHVPYNDSYLDSQIRETKEEIGLKILQRKYEEIGKIRITTKKLFSKINDRFMTLYAVYADYKISTMKPQKGEVKSLKYYSLEELSKIPKNQMTKSLRKCLKLYKEFIKTKNSE